MGKHCEAEDISFAEVREDTGQKEWLPSQIGDTGLFYCGFCYKYLGDVEAVGAHLEKSKFGNWKKARETAAKRKLHEDARHRRNEKRA